MNAELTIFLQSYERRINCEGQFHGEFGRHNRGNDEDTIQQELALGHSAFQAYSDQPSWSTMLPFAN